MKRNADVIAEALAAAGCKHAFGIPGGEVLTIIDALERAGITFHLTKHENVAGFMAEGSWHATGAPGILVATIGPGVANAVNVIANAEQDRVPMMVLTGCMDGADADTYTHQVFDHQAVLEPVTKATFRANHGSVAQVMEKAIAIMTEGQPGPVHLDLPIKVADAEAPERIAIQPVATVGTASSEALQTARTWLKEAERPLVIAGLDALNADAADELTALVKAIGAPIVTTYKGKGLIDEADPMVLGGAGLSPLADRHLMPLLAAADTIILAGYDPIEMRVGWRDPWPVSTRVIDITPVTRTHGMHTVSLTLPGDVRANIAALSDVALETAWPDGAPGKTRAALQAAFSPEPEGWGPAAVFAAAREAAPLETVATADSGAHRILVSQMWRCPAPRTMLQSSALCTMGCAVPLAAGHKLAEPETPVLAFVGDAGLEMALGDLATVRDLKLAVPIMVLIDESLALIEMKQRGSQLRNVGVDFSGTDFPALAAAMGGHGVWLDDTETLKRELMAAFERPTFTLLCARIGRRAYDGKF